MLERKNNIKSRGLAVVVEELKQRALVKRAKVKRCEQGIKQYRQNRMFHVDQKKFLSRIVW